MVKQMNNTWTKYETNLCVGHVLEIVEDALAHGFEFKVENHELYFREV